MAQRNLRIASWNLACAMVNVCLTVVVVAVNVAFDHPLRGQAWAIPALIVYLAVFLTIWLAGTALIYRRFSDAA